MRGQFAGTTPVEGFGIGVPPGSIMKFGSPSTFCVDWSPDMRALIPAKERRMGVLSYLA